MIQSNDNLTQQTCPSPLVPVHLDHQEKLVQLDHLDHPFHMGILQALLVTEVILDHLDLQVSLGHMDHLDLWVSEGHMDHLDLKVSLGHMDYLDLKVPLEHLD